MELQPGGADAVLGSGAQGAHARAPRPAPPPRHGSSAWRPSSRRPMERRGPWLAQAAEPRADPARGRRKRTARARPPPPLPPPLLQCAGSTAHMPATAAPRSTAFSPRILRPRAPTLLSRWRTPASTPCSGFAAARRPLRRTRASPPRASPPRSALPRAGAPSAAGGREAGELDALPRRSVRAATGGRPCAASHGRREQGPWPPDPARSSSAPWPRAAATSSSWRRKAGVGGVRPPPPPQSRRGRPCSAVAAPPARVGLRARAAQATGRGSRGGGRRGPAPEREIGERGGGGKREI